MRQPGQGRSVAFKVTGVRLDGASEATVRISPAAGGFVVTVKPKGRRREYRLSLAEVAQLLAEVAQLLAWRRVAKVQAVQTEGR